MTTVFPPGKLCWHFHLHTQEHCFLKVLGYCLLRGNILYHYIFFPEPNLSRIMNELSFQIATQDANVQRQNGNLYVVRMESRMHRLVLLVVKPPPGVERRL